MPLTGAKGLLRKYWAPALLLLTLVWALINIFVPISSLIVLFQHGGYRPDTLVVDRIHYDNDFESGLTWGVHGRLRGEEARLYAPDLADGKALGYAALVRRYPPGSQIPVLYNPEVTGTLFNHRTLRVLPFSEDLVAVERDRLFWWVKFCLIPFVLAWFIMSRREKHTLS